MSRAIRSFAALCAALFFVGCVDETAPHGVSEGDASSVAIKLEATSPAGARYRLRDFTVELVGPVSVTLASEDFPSDAASMSATLPSGSYTATVQSGWKLDRLFDETPVEITATLVQPSLSFTVLAEQTASVSFAFRTFDDFETPGGVDVGFTVDDSAPSTWSTPPVAGFTPVAVTSDDMGNVYALVQVGSGLSLVGYTSWGAVRFTTALPTGGSLQSTSSFDVRAIEGGRVRAAWDALQGSDSVLMIATVDSLTGTTLSSMQRPFDSLGFDDTFFNAQIHATIAIGDLGSVAIASMPTQLIPGNSRLAYLDDGVVVTTQMDLGLRVNGEWSSDIRLALAGTDERVFIGIPISNGGNHALRLISPFGGTLWSTTTQPIASLSSDTAGNLFALQNSSAGLIRYNAANGLALWSTGTIIGATRLSAGSTGVAVVGQTTVGGPWQARRYNTANGSLIATVPIPFSFPNDVFADIAIDASSAVAMGIRRVAANGVIGRVVP